MKGSSQSPAPSPRPRLASVRPGLWLVVILVLGITGLLCWQRAGREKAARSSPASAATSAAQRSEARIVTGVGRKAGDGESGTAAIETSSPAVIGYDGELAIAQLVRSLNDEKQSKETRQRAALALARDGSAAAVRALKEALASGTPEFQELVAETLGQCTNSASGNILEGLLTSANEPLVLSAIRSLSQQASPLAVADLGRLLNDEGRSVDVRAEAALGLGAIARPEALAAPATAAAQIQDESVASQVIRGIAGRSFDETQSFIQAFLDAPHVSTELKVEALEGLSQAKGGDPTSLLLNYAKSSEPDLRAAAARALGALETPGTAGADIIAWLNEETNPLVRKRLYQALAHQESFDLNAAWVQTANERDSVARIAGMDLLAKAVRQSPSSEVIAFFDERALPELKNAALNGGTSDERMASVMVLRKVRTANAIAALREIAVRTSDSGVAAATGVALRPDVRR